MIPRNLQAVLEDRLRQFPAVALPGPRVPAEALRRFWTMLAHRQGGELNAASLARSLGVDGKTVAKYLDLMVDLLLVRRLPPFHANVRKRLVPQDRYPGQRHRAYALAA